MSEYTLSEAGPVTVKPMLEVDQKLKELDISLVPQAPSWRQRTDVEVPNARVFFVDEFLLGEECSTIMRATQKAGYENLDSDFDPEYRRGERVTAILPELAASLWARLKICLVRADALRIRPIGFGNEGVWVPIRLNECFKFSRYQKGGHFQPHIDGPWVPREDESSVFTVIVYLNSDYDGGTTSFLHPTYGNKEAVITAKTGRALVFTHDALHQGDPVTCGTKYIMRTELMFTRVNTNHLVSFTPFQSLSRGYQMKPTYIETVKLYKQAEIALESGDRQKFVTSYLRALELQRQEQASVCPTLKNLHDQSLPLVCYLHIFSFVRAAELTRYLLVSKNWYDMARDGALWRALYLRRWPLTQAELKLHALDIDLNYSHEDESRVMYVCECSMCVCFCFVHLAFFVFMYFLPHYHHHHN